MTLEDFEQTARRLRPRIHKMAYRFFQNTEDAEDVAWLTIIDSD